MDDETPTGGLDKIAAALAAFQAEVPTVAKSHTATVKSDKGSYSYTYAGLANVTEVALPILAKHGLAFVTVPGGGVLTGMLLHTSGQSLTGSLPITGGTPQAIGSSLTYMRRYLLGCMTGLVTDEDDDGQVAQAPSARQRGAASGPTRTMSRTTGRQAKAPADDGWVPPQTDDAAAPPTLPSVEGVTPPLAVAASSDPITKAQLTKLHTSFTEAGIADRDKRLTYVANILGVEVASSKDLTKAQAHKIIESLEAINEAPFGDEPPLSGDRDE